MLKAAGWARTSGEEVLLKKGRRRLRTREAGRDLRRGRNRWHALVPLLRGAGELLLNAAREFVLPLGRHGGVVARHLKVGVASDFGGLDRAAADLLPPGDIGSSERVRPQTGEVGAIMDHEAPRERSLRDLAKMRAEAKQIAAMALRFMMDVTGWVDVPVTDPNQ